MSLTSSPPALDPPFRGYIETTFDALLVFEAARRGMIPRVTRRLIERERGMVQSGAVFVFDEHESGIKRWTDGLVWSPSRILGNFLVYRETEKRSNQPPTPISSGHNTSPIQSSPSIDQNSRLGPGLNIAIKEEPSAFGHGALPRPRSASDGGSNLDRQRERQLVGSLVNSSKFKDRGLVKKTMSVTVNGFAQHMISYYTMEDVMSGRLRSPSSIPELASLEISPEYLHKQNFRFPPMIEVGADGIPRYRGEPEEPTSPQSPSSGLSSMPSFGTSPSSAETFDSYGHNLPHHMRMTQQSSPQSRNRSVTVPMPPPLPSPGAGPAHHHLLLHGPPGQSAQSYYDQGNAGKLHGGGINRQNSSSSLASSGGAMRPSSSSQRFDPYAPASTSPRAATSGSMHSRRPSQPMIIPPGSSAGHSGSDYFPSPTYDVKPSLSPDLSHAHDLGQHTSYSYHPPATAPGSFADFGAFGSSAHQPVQSPGGAFGPSYAAWHHPSPSTAGRLNQPPPGREFGQLHHSPSHSHVSSHHSHSQSASGSQSLGVLMEAPSASSSNDGWGTPTHTHNQLPENPSGVNSFSQQVPQGWNGQYMGGDNDWRGQSTSVG